MFSRSAGVQRFHRCRRDAIQWVLFGRGLNALGLPGTILLSAALAEAQSTRRYEVWAADQNGNVIYMMDPQGAVLRSFNVAEAAMGNRPHLLTPSPDGSLVLSANT